MAGHTYHSLKVNEALTALETTWDGLSDEEAAARLELYGPNLFHEIPHPSQVKRFLVNLNHPIAWIYWISGGLAFILQEWLVGGLIWFGVLVNASFTFWREYSAGLSVAALNRLLPNYVRLVRHGVEMQIPADQIVPGDILIIAEGDQVAADARLIEAFGLRINNSVLTGEATPARKSADASFLEGISDLDRPNLIFAGTTVVGGVGRAMVYSTGMLTQIGRIAHLTQISQPMPSPIQLEINRTRRILAFSGLLIGAVTLISGIMDIGLPFKQAFFLAMCTLVASTPVGIAPTLSLTLALAASRLAQQKVLVKRQSTIEQLGAMSVLCTDKSGTLTQNQMTVREVWVSGQKGNVTGVGYDVTGKINHFPLDATIQSDLKSFLIASALCNNSRLIEPSKEHPQWRILGDQTEAALQVLAMKGGVKDGPDSELSKQYPRFHEIPFDARRKRMSTIHQKGNESLAFVKGAPREVLALCSMILLNGQEIPLENKLREEILSVNDDFARDALRVLGLARRSLPPRQRDYQAEQVERDLTFLGLAAMMDPPRPEVSKTIESMHQASIRMTMITGDYGLTAESLARRVGMLRGNQPRIITGVEVDAMDDAELKGILDEEVLFARMAPEHKLRLVALYQAKGEIVAMTGDGVNDAPALRKADIGISMGISGTDVSKENADLILTDDRFASIGKAIAESRAVYENIRKFMTFMLSSSVPMVLPFMLTALIHLPLALSPRQILIIILGTNLFTALALGQERPEPNILKHPSAKRQWKLLNQSLLLRSLAWLGLIEVVLCFTAYFFFYDLIIGSNIANWLGPGLVEHLGLAGLKSFDADTANIFLSTVFFVGVVMAQIGNAYTCRSEKLRGAWLGWSSNRALTFSVWGGLALVVLMVYLPWTQKLLGLYPLPAIVWMILALFAPVIYGLDWLRKKVVRIIDERAK